MVIHEKYINWNDAKNKLAKLEIVEKKKKLYYDYAFTFDIETTYLEKIECSVMYVWQCYFLGDVVVGRTWEEYHDFTEKLDEIAEAQCVFFVHNLSFEFAFLSGEFDFEKENVWVMKPHKILTCTYGKIEYRCSYYLTNMSLAQVCKKYEIETQKLRGTKYNYKKHRYSTSKLSHYQWMYCINDVISLHFVINKINELENDNIATMPLTSTGYVRREFKNVAYKDKGRKWYWERYPDEQEYIMLRNAFRGGDCHANRFYSGRILENVHSVDRSSSYPDELCNRKFPVDKFYKEDTAFTEKLLELDYACLIKFCAENVRLRDRCEGFPSLSFSKCSVTENVLLDNGRVLSANVIITTMTEIDFKTFMEIYAFDNIFFIDLYATNKAKLDESFINLNIEYYRKKTELKGIPGQEVFYMKSKNKLNSIYGMTATDIGKNNYEYVAGELEFNVKQEELNDILKANKKSTFCLYSTGVYVTAYARKDLFDLTRIVGNGFVYSDTDSVKYIGEADFSEYNKERIKASKESGAFATDKHGITHYMGVAEIENTYNKFITFGAKKYAYEINGKLGVVISGVSKDVGAEYLKKHGGLESLNLGFVFPNATKRAIYSPEYGEYRIDGNAFKVGKSVSIVDSDYTLSLSQDYWDLLNDTQLIDTFLRLQ